MSVVIIRMCYYNCTLNIYRLPVGHSSSSQNRTRCGRRDLLTAGILEAETIPTLLDDLPNNFSFSASRSLEIINLAAEAWLESLGDEHKIVPFSVFIRNAYSI